MSIKQNSRPNSKSALGNNKTPQHFLIIRQEKKRNYRNEYKQYVVDVMQ